MGQSPPSPVAASWALNRDGQTGASSTLPSWNFPPTIESGPPGSKEEQVRLSLRIVVLLSQIGPPGADGVAKSESTQRGMAQVLSVTQGAVSKVVNRLVIAGVILRERHHVRGQGRRVRIYFLTSRGEGLAREIRERFGLPSELRPSGQHLRVGDP